MKLKCEADNSVSLARFSTPACLGEPTGKTPVPFTPGCHSEGGPFILNSTCIKGDFTEPLDKLNLELYDDSTCAGVPYVVESFELGLCIPLNASTSAKFSCTEPGYAGLAVEFAYSDSAACTGPSHMIVNKQGCGNGESSRFARGLLVSEGPESTPSASPSRSSTHTRSRTPSNSPAPPAPPGPAPGPRGAVYRCPK